MWEFIHKIILLFLERKNKFKSAKEKLERRIVYFDDLKKINELTVDDTQKRATRNALAQTLVGSQLVSYYLVDFLIKNKNITNFEIVAKNLSLWETSLDIEKDSNNVINQISLNQKEYRKEKIMLITTLFFTFLIFLYSLYIFKESLNWLENYLFLPNYIALSILIFLIVFLLGLVIFLFITTLFLFDLDRIVKLLNNK